MSAHARRITSAGHEVVMTARDLSGGIVIDITNPLKPDMSGLTIGHTTSFAEELARALPGVRVVKAFNTVFAQVLSEGPDLGQGIRASAFYCADDGSARKTVHKFIESLGFDAVDAGPLANARYLELMGMLNICSATWSSKGRASFSIWQGGARRWKGRQRHRTLAARCRAGEP